MNRMRLTPSRTAVLVLFVLFLIINSLYLHRVPGLLGDEGSEGENVWELVESGELTIAGERSYIGPAIDYLRVPFIGLFGYSAFSLRLLILLFSIATFWLTVIVCRRLWGEEAGLVAAGALLFSPVYILYQRLGWAITLFPFFLFLTLFLATTPRDWRIYKNKCLLVGFVVGLGLHNHIIFLATIAGLLAGAVVYMIVQYRSRVLVEFAARWPALIGFAAGFGTQLAVLALNTEDQGSGEQSFTLLQHNLEHLWGLLPQVISGSSYVARYVGFEFSPLLIMTITWIIVGLAGIGVVLAKPRKHTLVFAFGLLAHLGALLYVIDRFTLRYFVVFVLGVWLLAGLGVGSLLQGIQLPKREWVPIGFAGILSIWMIFAVFVPFIRSGGSVNEFSLGNRSDSAAAFVDAEPLFDCLRGIGPVSSENVHIWNRIQYVSHSISDIEVVPDTELSRAQWIIHYREDSSPGGTSPGDICLELTHFRVVER